ncbi:hypothetical protein [Aquisphaera insulae]|uniref:hypothetical protein n=1 Tax=Aquisphaera insulae TaxID=2712864 RepID=UPI0013EA944D|nr:hypothetical protein [Aquisphaera insulae]
MISDARIEANRRNARKSTGPKTEAGKMVSRLNGLIHGKRSKILSMPVLPQEDPRDLARLVADFIRDGRPADALERSLLVRAARLTWMLERSDRAESAHLANTVRARRCPRIDRTDSSEARSRRVRDLGVQLFHPLSPHETRDPDWQDDPASCLAGLEETREGCRWLLEQWRSIRAYFVAGKQPLVGDFYRFIRLHGRKVTDLFWDLDLNAVMAAAEVAFDGCSREIYAHYLRGLRAEEFGTYEQQRQWWTFAAPPATKEEAMSLLLADAEARMDRLAAMLGDDDDEIDDDAAAFAAERDLDRHRRTVAARSRELMQTLEMLRKLRKERGGAGLAPRDPVEPNLEPEPEPERADFSSGASPPVPSPTWARGPELDASLLSEEELGHGETSDIEPEPEAAAFVEADRWEPAPIVIAEDEDEPLPADVRDPKPPGAEHELRQDKDPETNEEFRRWVASGGPAGERSERTQDRPPRERELQKNRDLLTLWLDTPVGRGLDYRKLPRRE